MSRTRASWLIAPAAALVTAVAATPAWADPIIDPAPIVPNQYFYGLVNDHAGHAAGDIVLQRVAARLRTTVRSADAVVRLGGEEFVALLHDCTADGAVAVATAMCKAVREIVLPDNCGLPRLTVSIDVATWPEHGPDLDHLLAAADRAMYAAKHSGRDGVERAPVHGADIVTLPKRSRAAERRMARAD